MSEWAPKRFYKDATFEREGDQFVVRLDGKPVRTPGKRLLAMPGEAMARHVAQEWQAQEGKIDPRSMPWTRSANTAIDKVATQRSEIMEHLSGYADTDLLCYRADSPDALVERQAQNWDPLLDWVLSGSFAIALAVIEAVQPADVFWKISRIDEIWQSEQWGVDEEAAAAAVLKREAFLHAHAFFRTAQE